MLIQKLRLQRGWSQEQLADLSGLSVRTVQRIERGQPASLETLKALGAAFEIDFSDLKELNMNSTSSQQTPSQTSSSQAVSNDEALALAHVRKLKGFYIHVAQYAITIAFLAVVNIATSRHYYWFLWVALAWGVGLLFHALQLFDKVPFLSGEWERRQVEKQLGRKL